MIEDKVRIASRQLCHGVRFHPRRSCQLAHKNVSAPKTLSACPTLAANYFLQKKNASVSTVSCTANVTDTDAKHFMSTESLLLFKKNINKM